MKRIGLVAGREFVATVANKGFIIGLLIVPLIGLLFIFIGPRIANARSPQVRGEVAVIDPTGKVTAELRKSLDPATIEARRIEDARRALTSVVGAIADSDEAIRRAVGQIPSLRVVERPADTDAARAKDWLIAPADRAPAGDDQPLALVVVHPDAVLRATGRPEYGTYDLYVSSRLNDATEGVIYESLRLALIAARLQMSSLDQAAVESMMRVVRPGSTIVAAGGERQAQRRFNRLLPLMLGVLMFTGVIIGGQTLMTSTIEEKSSRVVEILLSAVSPIELMAGKLIGQLAVSLLTLSVYLGLGLMALVSFAMIGLVEPMLVVYLLLFFLITYLVFGALMAAIGAAVNQMAEAQSLMGPIMLLLLAPYMLTPMIGRAPNSTFSIIVSFIPPVNTFAMMARLASESPPPAWQVWLTMVIGLAAAGVAVWFAAKIFKIGLLMHGKPPNFATLIRWARAA